MHPTIEILNIKISVFSVFLLVAITVCLITYVVNKKYHMGYTNEIVKNLVVALIGAAVIGRLLSALTLLQTSSESFLHNLIYGGFVFYGGVIGGLISLCIYSAVTKSFALDVTDVFISLLPLGQAIGRIGCYMNGCCYGVEYHGSFSVAYMVDNMHTRVFPTWFWEAAFCLLLAIYFQIFCRVTKRGFHVAVYFLTYSIFRFVIEFFRGDDIRGVYGWISTSQIISLLLFVTGACLLRYSLRKNIENQYLNQRRTPHES